MLHAGFIYATRAYNSLTCRYAEFKVVGNASVHLSGYYMPEHGYGEHYVQNWRTCQHASCINGTTGCPLKRKVAGTSLCQFRVSDIHLLQCMGAQLRQSPR